MSTSKSAEDQQQPQQSLTAHKIPILKKGEYDLWAMKMRQYIAITDHILWDVIQQGNHVEQAPAKPTGPNGEMVTPAKVETSPTQKRNQEKALNILLSAIPDIHLMKFKGINDAKILWAAIQTRFGGNETTKKLQKNLLKQQYETFVGGTREDFDAIFERFQHILSMLELYGVNVDKEDANMKFLRALPPQ